METRLASLLSEYAEEEKQAQTAPPKTSQAKSTHKVYICVCVCMYVCMHVYMYIYIYIYMYILLSEYVEHEKQAHAAPPKTSQAKSTHKVYICLCVYVYVCMYIYI